MFRAKSTLTHPVKGSGILARAEGSEVACYSGRKPAAGANPYMKILWVVPWSDLENICRFAELYGPEYAFLERAVFGAARKPMENGTMSDILLLALGLGLFALLALYGFASERL